MTNLTTTRVRDIFKQVRMIVPAAGSERPWSAGNVETIEERVNLMNHA